MQYDYIGTQLSLQTCATYSSETPKLSLTRIAIQDKDMATSLKMLQHHFCQVRIAFSHKQLPQSILSWEGRPLQSEEF